MSTSIRFREGCTHGSARFGATDVLASRSPLPYHDELREVAEIPLRRGFGHVCSLQRLEGEVCLPLGPLVRLLDGEAGHLDERRAVHLFVLAGRLPQVVGVGGRVQDVVPDLERDAHPLCVLAERLDGERVGVGGDGPQLRRRPEQRPGLTPGQFHVRLLRVGVGDEFGRLPLAEFDHRLGDDLGRPIVGGKQRERLTE